MNKTQAIAAIKYGSKLGLALEPGALTRRTAPELGFGRTLWGVRCGFTGDGPRIFWTVADMESHARQHNGRGPAICG
jgi:hypothetical protein